MAIKVLGAFIAIYSFAILLESPKKYLWCSGVVAAVGWLVYVFSGDNGLGEVFATFLSAASIALLSHIFARIFKTPVTVFLIAGILPTVPGAGMYRIVYYMIQKDTQMSSYYFISTLELAGSIAMALFIVDGMFRVFQKGWKQNSLRYAEKKVDKL